MGSVAEATRAKNALNGVYVDELCNPGETLLIRYARIAGAAYGSGGPTSPSYASPRTRPFGRAGSQAEAGHSPRAAATPTANGGPPARAASSLPSAHSGSSLASSAAGGSAAAAAATPPLLPPPQRCGSCSVAESASLPLRRCSACKVKEWGLLGTIFGRASVTVCRHWLTVQRSWEPTAAATRVRSCASAASPPSLPHLACFMPLLQAVAYCSSECQVGMSVRAGQWRCA